MDPTSTKAKANRVFKDTFEATWEMQGVEGPELPQRGGRARSYPVDPGLRPASLARVAMWVDLEHTLEAGLGLPR